MRLSLSWIARCLGMDRLPIAHGDLQARLTMRTAEIASITSQGRNYDHIVVGRVLTCAPHPSADRLRVTTVDVGVKAGASGDVLAPIPVVCGAPNCGEGLWVAVALPGAVVSVPGKDGSPTTITIKAGKLRGEPSHGMLCAADELGIPGGHDGLLLLDPSVHPGLTAGQPIREVLPEAEAILEVENIAVTHRPDLWGHRGWAREIAALLSLPLPAAPCPAWVDLGAGRQATLADPGCSLWLGTELVGVSDGPSPAWMRERLEAVGVRSLGRLVDVTAWVMLEIGHPLHAFDAEALQGNIQVRAARVNEEMAGLDGKKHVLTDTDLVIADQTGAAALAGIVGGTRTAVHPGTTRIVIESAVFTPARIRRSRLRLGIATDAAARFEKGQSAGSARAAMAMAVALYLELCPGATVVQRLHGGNPDEEPRVIPFDLRLPAKISGLDMGPEQARGHLLALGLDVITDDKGNSHVRVPWWRHRDVHGSHDLVEEVVRSHGYAKIQGAAPRLPMVAPPPHPLRTAEHRLRDAAGALGWDEVVNYAFTSEAWADALDWAEGTRLRLQHPLSSEQTVLRQSLLPGLAAAAAHNSRFRPTVHVYEIGRRYGLGMGTIDTPMRDERTMVAGMCIDGEQPFFAARDQAIALAKSLGYVLDVVVAAPHPALVPGRGAHLMLGKKVVGMVGELPSSLRRLVDLSHRAGWFELDLEALLTRTVAPVQLIPPSKFQRVEREFTFVAAESLAFAELAAGCRQGAGEVFDGVELVTIYRGDPIPAGHKAVSVKVGLLSQQKTLDEAALSGAQTRIVNTVSKRCGATLRA